MTGEATDLVALKRLAEEATPGPWEPVSLSGYGSPFSIRMAYQSDNPNASKTHYGIQSVRTWGDAAFIAAANPATILSLATLIEAQAAEIEEARRLLERFDKEWNSGSGWAIRMDDLGDEVRAFLASRTEKADG